MRFGQLEVESTAMGPERESIRGRPRKEGGRGGWVAGLAAILLLLGIVLYDPLISDGLFRDVTQHEALFRQAAAEVLKGHAVSQDDPRFRALFKLGYFQVDNHHGAVLFWRWVGFASAPPHFENKQLPAEFYIFSEE